MNEQPTTNEAKIVTPKTDTLINGPLLLMLTVLLVLILTAMFYWFTTMTDDRPVTQAIERPSALENNEPESTTAEAQTEIMLTTSTSDTISAIEADLGATSFDSLDAEMIAIEAELDISLQNN